MTAPHIVDPAHVLGNLLTQASPDMMRTLLQTLINALLSADADQVCGAEWGQPSADRLAQRNGAETALITVVADCYLAGVSTRRMDKLVKTLGIDGLSKSQVSRMAAELDQHVNEFRHRPLADAGPFTFVAADALTMKVREGGRVINVAVLVATGPKRAWRWGKRGLLVWRGWRMLRNSLISAR